MVMSSSINSGEPPVALKKAVCAGRITLAQAQQAIAQNWASALRRLGYVPGPNHRATRRQRLIDLLADSFLEARARATPRANGMLPPRTPPLPATTRPLPDRGTVTQVPDDRGILGVATSERAWKNGAPGVRVDGRLAVSGHGRSGEQVPLCLYCLEELGQLSAGGCSAGAARFDMACAPAADGAPAAGGHDGPVGDLEQVFDAQSAGGRPQLLCLLCFLRRDAGEQGGPLDDED